MNSVRLLANLAGFQLGWFACVLGGSLVGGAVVAPHLRWLARAGEWRWLVGFAALGLAIDGGVSLAGGFRFDDEPRVLGLLWPLFASLLHHALAWLWRHPWLAALGGAIGGPLSYLAGARLADVELAPWLLAAEALVWAGLCLWLCHRLGEAVGGTRLRAG